ncbi:hypothetical protein SAMN04487761_1674 [Lachnospiraceae bacterium C7]|nr:hypothetical protein SAMN04487761_1674 [Lachnospiraceae bacterium C7]
MKKQEELYRKLIKMVKDTKDNKIQWKVWCQTTEYNDDEDKPKETVDGVTWTVDECYVSYECEYEGNQFVMITYEMMHTDGIQQKTTSFICLPPLGVRYFDIVTLLPYTVENSQMLTYAAHSLWIEILEKYKENNPNIDLKVESRQLTID